MTTAPITASQAKPKRPGSRLRPYAGFNAEYDGIDEESDAIDKRGFGLVGIIWAQHSTAITATVLVSHLEAGPFIAHPDIDTLDLTAAGLLSIDKLAEWPFFRVDKNAAEAIDIDFVLT